MKKKNHSAIINLSSALFGFVFATGISINIASCSTDPDTGEITEMVNENKEELNQDDKDFLMFAAETNLLEIATAKLARDKSASEEVKELAKLIEKDHKKALVNVTEFGMIYKINLPEDLNETGQETYDLLLSKTGNEFDTSFYKIMAEGHTNAIKKFEAYANEGSSKTLKEWAQKLLPVLRKHLDHVQKKTNNVSNL